MQRRIIIQIVFLILYLFLPNNSFCKDNLILRQTRDTVYYKNVIDPGEVVLKYKAILAEDSREHREYLESLYKTTIAVFGFLGIVIITLFYSILGKTKKEIKNQVDEIYRIKINDIIQEQTSTVDTLYKKQLNNFTYYTKRLLIDLMSKAVIKTGDVPLPYINYESLDGKRILWVDNKPFNNTQHREVFSSFGVEFITISTTEEAIKLLTSDGPFDLIISNMGRPPKEKEEDNPKEGIVFLKNLKTMNIDIPKIIYTKPVNVEEYSDEVNHLGASITQGYSGLFKEILRNIAK